MSTLRPEPSALAALARRLPRDGFALLFVALVWLLQTYLLWDFVETYGSDVPYYDEWEMVPALMGAQKISLRWLWMQHNEHRIFLPRLVYLAVEKLGGCDFRAGMFFDAALLSAAAAACCLVVRRIRGATSYADAFFPLVLLHWGQSDNLMASFQIAFVLPAILILLALLFLISPGRLSARASLAVGLCAVCLPLTGGAGLALAPALGICSLLSAWDLRAAGGKRAEWISALAAGVLSFALTAFYFVGYERPAKHPVSPSIEATVSATLQIMSVGLGSGTRAYWPVGGYLVVGFALASAALLVLLLVRSREERARALRIGLFLGGMASLAGGIAWARAALYPQGLFESRYVPLVVPFFCAIYFSWELTKRSQLKQFMQMLLFLVAALMVVRNRDHGAAEAMSVHAPRQAILQDARNGMSRAEFAARHCHYLYEFCNSPVFAERLRMLRDAGIGDFAALRD